MVDYDIRINSHAHSAGLKRLSARAHAGATPASTGGRRVFFSFAAYARTAIDHLINCGVPIEKGLSDEEFARVEAAYGFTFPPDLRAILQEGLPVGHGFPNWRDGGFQQLRMRFDLPSSGLLYEVARANMWWKQWGPRPVDLEQAVRLARASIRKAPVLVPVYSHCYIPASPNLAGNPVFFVYLKDVFISGIDIADFFQRDQFTPHGYEPPTNLPDVMEWIGDSRSRVTRTGSERDFLTEKARLFYGKNNLITSSSGVSDDNNINSSTHEAQHHTGSGIPAWRLSEVLAEKSDEGQTSWDVLDGDFESWGRSLDTLVAKHSEVLFNSLNSFSRRPSWKSLECSSSNSHQQRLSRPVSKNSSNQDIVTRLSYFEDMLLSSKILMHFSVNAPPWARAGRRIEFWSELTEKRLMTTFFPPDTLFSAHSVDCDVANNSKARWDWEETDPKESATKFHRTLLPNWVVSYLEDISLRLRKGGWNEDDIVEIMGTSRPPMKILEMEDKQSVLDSLSRQAVSLSASLRKAGWSIRDVADVLDLDFSFGDHRPVTSKLSPELAARLSTFAEYVVNT